MKKIFTLLFIVSTSLSFGQILTENFDDNSGFTTSTPFFSDGAFDYFGLAIVDDYNTQPVPTGLKAYTGFTGGFLAGMDLDGEGATLPIIIDFTGLDIEGFTDLMFSGEFAEFFDTPGDIDAADFILLEYQIDGGGFQNLLAFEGADFSSGTNNGFFREDTDFDGEGDGDLLTDTALAFTKAIVGTGVTLDLRMTISLDSGDEDFAADTFTITGTSADTTPPVFTNCIISTNEQNDAGVCEAVVNFDTPTATDDTDPNPVVTQTGGPVSGSSFPVGTTEIEFTATDAAGNSSTCTFDVIVVDTEEPVLTCFGGDDYVVTADGNGEYVLEDFIAENLVTAVDNCLVDVTTQSPAPATVLSVGTTEVTITAEDAAGNFVECTFNVVVEPLLGVGENTIANFGMYPNPATNNVVINAAVEMVKVYNVVGQTILETSQNTFNVSSFTAGTYFVKVTTKDGTATKQLLVK
jgi:hypothetical protein